MSDEISHKAVLASIWPERTLKILAARALSRNKSRIIQRVQIYMSRDRELKYAGCFSFRVSIVTQLAKNIYVNKLKNFSGI